ncbi:glycosyltransferase family 4 protein [Paracoccus ravus]|uniref:glycosyltransferase family 4 protein n=1 Tax=Paracoccus ravus TaxID=2447760 RepID=UPI00142FC2E7|nr:glycosyltransferase [Paracoccus ravus]
MVLQLTDKGPGGGGIRRVVELHGEILTGAGLDLRRLRLLGPGAASTEAALPVRPGWGARPSAQEAEAFRAALVGADVIHLHLGFHALAPWHVEIAAQVAPVLAFLHDVSPFRDQLGVGTSAGGWKSLPEGVMARLRAGTRRALWQMLIHRAAFLVAPSAYLARLAVTAGAVPGRVLHLPHPLAARAAPAMPLGSDPVLLYAGRLSPEKGVFLLAETLARIGTPGARLIVLGAGPAEKRMKQQVARLGLDQRVAFLGQIPPDTVPDHLGRARAVLHPSLVAEGLGLAGIEAMQAGRPVAGFGLGGTSDWLIDGRTGLVAPPGDVRALAAAADRLLCLDGLAEALGASAHDHVSERFSHETVARGLLAMTVGAIGALA